MMTLYEVLRTIADECDLESVVRCRDCKKRYIDCPMHHVEWTEYEDDGFIETDDVVYDYTEDDGFCFMGERGEADDE